MSSIEHLPTELVLVIFSRIYGSEEDNRQIPHTYPLADVRLAHRRWNTIVKDTPAFWTTIWFSRNAKFQDPEWKSFLTTQLKERSETLPLDIVINQTSGGWGELDLLIPYARRWRSFILLTPGFSSPFDLDCLPKMPNLVTLGLHNLNYKDIIMDLDAPKLERFECRSGWVCCPRGPTPPLRVIDLRFHTEIAGAGGIDLGILMHCKNTLEELSIDANWPLEGLPPDRVTFPRMEVLRLNQWTKQAFSALHVIHMPNLRSLSFLQPPLTAPSLGPSPSFSNLESLSWPSSRSKLQRLALARLLAACPNLRILSITGTPLSENADVDDLSHLIEHDDSGGAKYCAFLEKLKLETMDLGLLVKLVNVRPTLKTVEVEKGSSEDCESREACEVSARRMTELEKRGVVLRVLSRGSRMHV